MVKVTRWKELIEDTLRRIFDELNAPEPLLSAMKYYVFQEGKRIRPLFTVAVASSLGGDERDASVVGSVIEIIHNYSLVHDDLPAMDNDDFRRGLPSCHRKFGEGMAVLAGDGLLNLAFEILSDRNNFRELSCGEILTIINEIGKRSGAEGMVGGQALDIVGEEDLDKVNLLKTSKLFEACFVCGGLVARRKEMKDRLEVLGRNIGVLFQLTDDLLDRDGYYALYGEEETRRRCRELYTRIMDNVDDLFEERGSEIKFLVEKIYKRVL